MIQAYYLIQLCIGALSLGAGVYGCLERGSMPSAAVAAFLATAAILLCDAEDTSKWRHE